MIQHCRNDRLQYTRANPANLLQRHNQAPLRRTSSLDSPPAASTASLPLRTASGPHRSRVLDEQTLAHKRVERASDLVAARYGLAR